MTASSARPPEVDRRALALLERLSGREDRPDYRDRLLRRESPEVLARLAALESGAREASRLLPTFDPALAPDREPPPARVGRFLLESRIGAGGMGEVWRGRRDDGLFDQTVAVKLIHAHITTRAAAAFEAERRILARLEHPAIARLIDGGATPEGRPYLVMEFVAGRPLDEACEGLATTERVRLVIQAAGAVAFAHSRLVAHGDLKPGNILAGADGRVRLLDFGVARLLDEVRAEGEGPTAHTQAFASPERLAGEPPSIADDVHALGVTLDLIVGEDVDADLRAVIDRARAGDPAGRHPSVTALVEDLELWLAHKPVRSRRASPVHRGRLLLRRRPRIVAAAAAAGALLALTLIVAGLNLARATREHAEAAARFADARGVARYLLYDLLERLREQPRALALRTEVAKTAQAELDRLARAEGADAAVRLETANGLWRLAGEQASNDRPNLREPDAARANLRRAAEIAAALPGPAARDLLARIRLDQAEIADAFDSDTAGAERYVDAASRLLADRPATDESSLRLALVRARLLGWQGRYAEEAAVAAQALRLARATPDPDRVQLRAGLADMQGEGEFYLGHLREAEASYRAEMADLEAAHRRWPADPFLLGLLSRSRWSLATTLEQGQHMAAAAPLLRRSQEESRAVLAFDPDDGEARRRFRISRTAYAQNLGFLGRTSQALTILRQQAADDGAAWAASPSAPQRLRDYAFSVSSIGEVLDAAGQGARACPTDALAMSLFDRLRAMGRLTTWDLDHNLAILRARRARYCEPAVGG